MYGKKKKFIVKLLVILFIVLNLLIAICCKANAIEIPDPNQQMEGTILNHHAKADEHTLICLIINLIILLTYIFTSLKVYKKVKEKNKKNEIILITTIYIFMTLGIGPCLRYIFADRIIEERSYINGNYIVSILFMILMAINTIFIIIKIINNFIKINKIKKEEKPKCQE